MNASSVFPLVQYANVGVSLLSIAMITINRLVCDLLYLCFAEYGSAASQVVSEGLTLLGNVDPGFLVLILAD